MRVLLTGASSFTGYWFAQMLAEANHEVVAPLQRCASGYTDGVRSERVRRLADVAEVVDNAPFGTQPFIELARGGRFDLLCHHAAQVRDYRSPDFDIAAAVAANTHNLRTVLADGAFRAVVLTGSVFEGNEGVGNMPLVAFSPYGLSKALTAQVVEYRCIEAGVGYGKFVIPNPFGPLEEPRFCAYLMRAWKAGDTAKVNTPSYLRDNIHVRLLALAYVRYAEAMVTGRAAAKLNPSGYVETQGAFAQRFARELGPRLSIVCELELARQTEFTEPAMRVNTDAASIYVSGWDEAAAWDELAEAYR